MRQFTDWDTELLYSRIRMLAQEADGFDLDEQDIYVNEIRQIIDELDDRIYKAVCDKHEYE